METTDKVAAEKSAAAFDTLMDAIYIPAFVKECAERGVPINTPEDLTAALDTAARLNSLAANVAAAGNSVLQKGAALLRQDMENNGLTIASMSASTVTPDVLVRPEIKAALETLTVSKPAA